MKRQDASRAIVFDLDGTLVDMRALYLRANQLTTKDVLGIELSEHEVHELMATGLPLRAAMRSLDENSADRLVEVFVQHYRRERADLVRAFPGMLELLTKLRSQGHPIAVVTSKLRDEARADLSATTMDRSIDVLVAFEDSMEHKPHPGPLLQALGSLRATDGVAIGDLPSDVVAARATGLTAIGVSWGYGSSEALVDAGAECVCNSAHDLELALDRLLSPERTAARRTDVDAPVRRITELPPDLDVLIELSRKENFGAVEVLRDRWLDGANRFAGPGQALFEARAKGGSWASAA